MEKSLKGINLQFLDKIDTYKINKKAEVIIKLTSAFWFITKIASYKLWISNRIFPLSPAFDFLENIPNFIHLSLFILFLTGITLVFIFPNKKILFVGILLMEIFTCLLDQNRWQPYEYQFILTFVFFLFYHKNKKQFLNYFAFLLLVIYLNSGLHKLNGSFLYTVWENMILHRFFGFEHELIKNSGLHYFGLLLGLIEVLAALGLFFKQTQKISAIALIGMHLFIIAMISPFGLNYNSIVWPWNILMILFLYVVFISNYPIKISFKKIIEGYNFVLFVLIGIMPFFCFLGIWDNFLSFNLYSGGTKYLEICVENPKELKKIEVYKFKKGKFCDDKVAISVHDWSLKELNITVYPERRILIDVIKKWKKQNPNCKATFYIYSYPYKKENIETFQ
ncbi:hypothetical protein ACFO3U_09235 [Flavobacterium ponti]|uniref:DoxX family membrane protein n=1 Tax=Flavobacterium ponti TaxID=665133 RepID=A0ABV9P713_9FLAO